MQWNCPHCGVTLAVPSDTLGTGWAFSRCYKCGGFALIRKAEVNIIKVDRAPPGERVILPEASTDFTRGMLNENAAQRLEYHNQTRNSSRTPATKTAPPPFTGHLPPTYSNHSSATAQPIDIATVKKMDRPNLTGSSKEQFIFPEPLPEIQKKHKKYNLIPIGIVSAALLTIASGTYLYIQGQALWEKTQQSALKVHALEKVSDQTFSHPAPSIQHTSLVQTPTGEPTHAPIAMDTRIVITDRVQESAMAPLKIAPNNTASPFLVRIRSKKANLHSGPGLAFPVINTATPDVTYEVSDWSQQWFKLKNISPTQPSAWVRNDLVQIVSESNASRITTPNINPLSK